MVQNFISVLFTDSSKTWKEVCYFFITWTVLDELLSIYNGIEDGGWHLW